MAQHEKFYLNGTWQLKKADETLPVSYTHLTLPTT